MQPKEGKFEGARGFQLHTRSWPARGEQRATIALVHGLGEHTGRYEPIASYFAEHGFAVHGYDLRGHGKSPGRRGHIRAWADFRVDLENFLIKIQKENRNSPLFLLGHSTGGLIVLDYALRRPAGISGVICSAPIVGKIGVSPFLWFLSALLNRVMPWFTMNIHLGQPVDEEPDPLVHSRASARLGSEVRQTAAWVNEHANRFTLPLLILHGSGDTLSSPEGSRVFIREVKFVDKKLIEYEECSHEPFNDVVREKALNDTARWIEDHLKRS